MTPHVYLDDKLVESMDNFIKENNYRSRSELISKAVEFYMDYTRIQKPGEFLPREIKGIMAESLGATEKRLGNRFGKLLSDTAIQIGILEQIMQNSLELNKDEISKYRKIAVDEIKSNQRMFKYEKLAE